MAVKGATQSLSVMVVEATSPTSSATFRTTKPSGQAPEAASGFGAHWQAFPMGGGGGRGGGWGGGGGDGGGGAGGDGGEGGEGHGCPRLVPVVTREAMADQADGTGPHRLGLPERSRRVRVLSVDQLAGMVERSPSELRTSEVRVERLDQEAGRVPPREGDLRAGRAQ